MGKMPLTTTFFKIADKIFVDPTREEEDVSEGRLTIEVSKPEKSKEELINAMQKGGEAALTIDDVELMVSEACKSFNVIKKIIDESIENFDKTEGKSKKKKE